MNTKGPLALAIPSLALAAAIATPASAQAQTLPLSVKPLSFSRSDQPSWRTLAIVFGAIAIIGAIDDDNTLVVVGVVGLAFCLVESGPRFRFTQRGFDLVHSGNFAAGVSYVGQPNWSFQSQTYRPAAYLRLSFRF